MRRHGSSQSGCSNISLLDELADSMQVVPGICQGNLSGIPLPVPEIVDAESNIEDEK